MHIIPFFAEDKANFGGRGFCGAFRRVSGMVSPCKKDKIAWVAKEVVLFNRHFLGAGGLMQTDGLLRRPNIQSNESICMHGFKGGKK